MPQLRPLAAYGLLCYVLCLATHGAGLYEPMHCDYSCRLRIARDWQQGAALYRETYCNTQPIVYLAILAVDSSNPAVTCYLAETLLAAVACVVFWSALRKRLPVAAPVIPLLLIVFSGVSSTFCGGQITEAPALWCDILGFSLFAMALQKGRSALPSEQRLAVVLAFLSGGFYLCEVGFRIPSAINAAACLPLLWEQRRHWKLALTLSGAAITGAVAAFFAFFLHGWALGYWGDFVGVFQRNLAYGSLDRVPLAASAFAGLKTLARIHVANTIPVLLLTVSATTLIWRRGGLRRAEKTMLGVAIFWLVAALISAFPGARHYDHYYHLCWPAITIGGCLWLGPLRRKLVARQIVAPLRGGLVAGALLAGLLIHLYSGAKALRDYHTGNHAWNAIEQAAAFLDEHVGREEPVTMNLWGDWAELYWRTSRPSPGLPVPHVIPRDLYSDWMAAVLANPPKWIVTDGTPLEPIDVSLHPDEESRLRLLRERILVEYREVQRYGEVRILARIAQVAD
jgi:hypothetical protein